MNQSFVDRPETETIISEIEAGTVHIHVRGEPGIGKSSLLLLVKDALPDAYGMSILEIPRYRGLEYQGDILRDIIELVHEQVVLKDKVVLIASRVEGASIPIVGGGLSIKSKDQSDATEFQKVASKDIAPDRYVLCLDEINKLAGDRDAIIDFLTELLTQLDDTTVVTGGTIDLRDATQDTTQIQLKTFNEPQSSEYLAAETDLTDKEIQRVHEELGGHPYFLTRFVNTEVPSLDDLPSGEICSFIEGRYLDALSSPVEAFLLDMTPLDYLHHALCEQILSRLDDVPSNTATTQTRRALQELDDEALVRVIRTPEDTDWYVLHDNFREYLAGQADTDRQDLVRRLAFDYYSQTAFADGRVSSARFTIGYNNLLDVYGGSILDQALRRELGATSLSLSDIEHAYPKFSEQPEPRMSLYTLRRRLRYHAHDRETYDSLKSRLDVACFAIYVFLAKLYWLELTRVKTYREPHGVTYLERCEFLSDADYWTAEWHYNRGAVRDASKYAAFLDDIPNRILENLPEHNDIVAAHQWAETYFTGVSPRPKEIIIGNDLTRVDTLHEAATQDGS